MVEWMDYMIQQNAIYKRLTSDSDTEQLGSQRAGNSHSVQAVSKRARRLGIRPEVVKTYYI